MKIDAEVKIVKSTNEETLKTGSIIEVTIDPDYIDDYDEVITSIENRIYDDYGLSLWNRENFIVLNESEICDKIFS